MNAREACELLGVAPGASREEVEKAFRAMRAKYHPDKVPATAGAAEKQRAREVYNKLTEARKVLTEQPLALPDRPGRTPKPTVTPKPVDERAERARQEREKKIDELRSSLGRDKPRPRRPTPIPTRPTRPTTTPVRTPSKPVVERPATRETSKPATAPKPTTTPKPATTPTTTAADASVALLRQAALAGRELAKLGNGAIRDGDAIQLSNGTTYTFRRVLWSQKQDGNAVRSVTPFLCRRGRGETGDSVLAPVFVAPRQRALRAGDDACQVFLEIEQQEVRHAVEKLAARRRNVSSLAAEIRGFLGDKQVLPFNDLTFAARTVKFSASTGTVTATVLCVEDKKRPGDIQILELQPGDPVEAGHRYADSETAAILLRDQVWFYGFTAAQARAAGRDVPALGTRQLGKLIQQSRERYLD